MSGDENLGRGAFVGGHLNKADSATVKLYFNYYAKLASQMNMLQDTTRTHVYKTAIVTNAVDFKNKVVMDVGAGSGILSFFAAQAGAGLVYAVEASSVASAMKKLKEANPECGAPVAIIAKPVEMVDPAIDFTHRSTTDGHIGKVDVLVSEPIGTFLFNERMIESYLYARDMFLKPGGKMYPNKAKLSMALFSDSQLYNEMVQKTAFWSEQNFFGLDVRSLSGRAAEEAFEQPILDYLDRNCLISPANCEEFNFETIQRDSLEEMKFNLDFPISAPSLVHGLAGWFEIYFDGSTTFHTLSTSPWSTGTHWQQIRFLLKTPLAVNAGQKITGTLHMKGNAQQSYHIKIHLEIEGTNISSESANIDLKDPDYRWSTVAAASSNLPHATAAAHTTAAAAAMY